MRFEMTDDQLYALLDAVKAVNDEASFDWAETNPLALFYKLETPGDGTENPSPVGEQALYYIHCWATDNR